MKPTDNDTLKLALKDTIRFIGVQAHNMHGMMRQHHNPYHVGVSWRKCTAETCKEAQRIVKMYNKYAPANHNQYALRSWLRVNKQVEVMARR